MLRPMSARSLRSSTAASHQKQKGRKIRAPLPFSKSVPTDQRSAVSSPREHCHPERSEGSQTSTHPASIRRHDRIHQPLLFRLSTVDYQLSSHFIFSNALTNASFPTCTDPRNGLLMSAIANNASAIINEKNTTCTPCKNLFCDPNMQDDTTVNTPPTINTNQSTVGSDS